MFTHTRTNLSALPNAADSIHEASLRTGDPEKADIATMSASPTLVMMATLSVAADLDTPSDTTPVT